MPISSVAPRGASCPFVSETCRIGGTIGGVVCIGGAGVVAATAASTREAVDFLTAGDSRMVSAEDLRLSVEVTMVSVDVLLRFSLSSCSAAFPFCFPLGVPAGPTREALAAAVDFEEAFDAVLALEAAGETFAAVDDTFESTEARGTVLRATLDVVDDTERVLTELRVDAELTERLMFVFLVLSLEVGVTRLERTELGRLDRLVREALGLDVRVVPVVADGETFETRGDLILGEVTALLVETDEAEDSRRGRCSSSAGDDDPDLADLNSVEVAETPESGRSAAAAGLSKSELASGALLFRIVEARERTDVTEAALEGLRG